MRKIWSLCLSIGLLNFAIGWSQSTVILNLPQLKVNAGDTILVPITTSDLTGKNVYNFNGKIWFRNNVVRFLDAQNDTCISAAWGTPTVNNQVSGQAIFACFGTQPLDGSGDLIKLRFRIVGNYNDTTSLKFQSFEFTRSSALTPQFSHGQISINPKPVRVTVTTTVGNRTQVQIDEQSYPAPYTVSWVPGEAHTIGIEAVQSGETGTRFSFVSWSDGGNRTHTVNPTSDVTYLAQVNTEYLVQVITDFGTATGEGWYRANTSAQIAVDSVSQITTTQRMRFQSWSGSGIGAYTGLQNPVQFTVMNPVTETAQWISQYWLGIATKPENLTPISGANWYPENQTVSVGPAPLKVGNRTFKSWKVDGISRSGQTISVVMDQSHQALADYSNDLSITVTTTIGAGTTVIIDGQTQAAPALVKWSEGTTHEIGAPESQNENSGRRWGFVEWSDKGARIHTVTPTQDVTYKAGYLEQYYLALKTVPELLGEISGSGWYEANQVVTTGTAPESKSNAGKYYSFSGWYFQQEPLIGNPLSISLAAPMTLEAHYYQNFFIKGQIKSGDLPLAQIKVLLGGGSKDSVFTNQRGEYLFQGLLPQNYTVRPVAKNRTFEPASRSYSFLLANQKLQDFNAKGTGVELLDREYPLEFDLEQNYPNPFNPQTTIRFHLPESGEMSLQIFTITGAAIRVLDQGFHDRGHYVRTWDGRDLHQQPVPSGVYYYQLRTSRSTITRKMILLR